MKPTSMEGYQLFMDSAKVFSKMEKAGIHVDIEYCKRTVPHLERQIKRIHTELMDTDLCIQGRKAFGRDFNVNSDTQLRTILFDIMGHKPILMTAGKKPKPSVKAEVLEALNIPGVNLLVRMNKLEKVKGTYLNNFVKEAVDGYMHPFFNLHTARTFRSSSSAPNFQNVPNRDPEMKKLCRQAIIPRPGRKLACLDFSGVEVRIGTAYHKDPTMVTYNSDPSTDMHRDMAQEIYKINKDMWAWIEKNGSIKLIRHSAKNEFVFPEFYGSYYKQCSGNLWTSAHGGTHDLPDGTRLVDHLVEQGLPNLGAFEKHLEAVESDFWDVRFPEYKAWKEKWFKAYQKKGYFDTLTGFRCQGVMSFNDAVNYPVQGSAFHCTLYSLIEIDKIIEDNELDSLLIGQIHDEGVIDLVPDEEEFLLRECKKIMTEKIRDHWKWINVPIDIEIELTPIDGSWVEKEEVKIC